MIQLHGGAPVFVAQDVSTPAWSATQVLIHLQAARESRRQPGQQAMNVFVADVDALYQELKDRGARLLNEPKDYAYGMRDFNVADLDGNELCFGMESKR
jgi:uncharacterized glyoxalase superfamily protein PhnB